MFFQILDFECNLYYGMIFLNLGYKHYIIDCNEMYLYIVFGFHNILLDQLLFIRNQIYGCL